MNHSRSILRTSPICFGATKNFTVLLSSVSGVLRIRSTRSEEHTSELQSQSNLVCRLLLEKKNIYHISDSINSLQFLCCHRLAIDGYASIQGIAHNTRSTDAKFCSNGHLLNARKIVPRIA